MATRTKDDVSAVVVPMALQAEAGVPEMVEPLPTQSDQGGPILWGMAGGAVWGEQPGMSFRLGMTGTTFQGSALENAFLVTGGTSQGTMPALQRKTGGGMVEIGHAVGAVMAGQTVRAVILQVSGHKDLIVAGMAILAALQRQRKPASSGMTGITIHGHRTVIQLVPAQAETGLIVIERCESRGGNINIPSKMIGMAVPALLDIGQAAMGARLGSHLVENRGVAA